MMSQIVEGRRRPARPEVEETRPSTDRAALARHLDSIKVKATVTLTKAIPPVQFRHSDFPEGD